MLSISLSHFYNDIPILKDVELNISEATYTAIVGPNGAGKSTLLSACAGILSPTLGACTISKTNVTRAYLPQASQIDRQFPLTVFDVAAMGLWSKCKKSNPRATENKNLIQQALCMVGLIGMENCSLSDLSGGQFQRLLFARLWLQDADILLLDEPFSAIDTPTTIELLALLKQWHSAGKTILIVIHQLDLVSVHIPNIILLNKSVTAHGHSKEILVNTDLIKRTFCA